MTSIERFVGKAFGSIGGYIAGDSKMTDFIRSYGSGFIFTTSMPPTVLASAIAAIDVRCSRTASQTTPFRSSLLDLDERRRPIITPATASERS